MLRFATSAAYYLAALVFNAFPLPQREAGARQTLRYMGELVEDGFSVLIFPEGHHTDTGEIDRFRPGIGMIARGWMSRRARASRGRGPRAPSHVAHGAAWACAGHVRPADAAGRRRLRSTRQAGGGCRARAAIHVRPTRGRFKCDTQIFRPPDATVYPLKYLSARRSPVPGRRRSRRRGS